MKATIVGITVAAVLVTALAVGYMVDVDQTQEAKLPDVDVEVTGGQVPKFDVETGSVRVTEEKVNVPVPEVNMVEKEVTVPSISITPPKDAAGEPVTETETN